MANNFASDANCIAIYNMESGAFTTDSKGGTFTLTYNDGTNPVTADTTNYWQGSSSALFPANSGWFTLSDTVGFPFNSADTAKTGTFCFWAKPGTVAIYTVFLGYVTYADAGSFNLFCNVTGELTIEWSWGLGYEDLLTGFTPIISHVYHIGFVVDGSGSAPTFHLRVADYGLDPSLPLGSPVSVTNYDPTPATHVMAVGSQGFGIGRWANGAGAIYVGNLDEIVICSDKKSDANIDLIRQGTYGAVTSTGNMFAVFF